MDTPAMQGSPQEVELLRAVARRMRLARIKEGLTHAELAEKAGLKKSYVFELERGTGNPTLKMINRVATALGVEPAELLPGSVRPQLPLADLERLRRLCERAESLIAERRTQQEEILKIDSDAARMFREALEGLTPLEQPADSSSAPLVGGSDQGSDRGQ